MLMGLKEILAPSFEKNKREPLFYIYALKDKPHQLQVQDNGKGIVFVLFTPIHPGGLEMCTCTEEIGKEDISMSAIKGLLSRNIPMLEEELERQIKKRSEPKPEIKN